MCCYYSHVLKFQLNFEAPCVEFDPWSFNGGSSSLVTGMFSYADNHACTVTAGPLVRRRWYRPTMQPSRWLSRRFADIHLTSQLLWGGSDIRRDTLFFLQCVFLPIEGTKTRKLWTLNNEVKISSIQYLLSRRENIRRVHSAVSKNSDYNWEDLVSWHFNVS